MSAKSCVVVGSCALRRQRPARVDQHVWKARGRGEVNVVLHGRGVHAGLETDAGRSLARPPVPRRLTGLDPGGVGDLRGRIEVENDVGLDQAPGLVADHEHAPRAIERSRSLDGDARLNHASLIGQRRQVSLDCVGEKRLVLAQIHAGVVVDIGLGNRHPAQPRFLGQKWQANQPVRMQSAHLPQLIRIFPGRLVALQNQRICGCVFGIGELS